ncbi:MAG: 4Fe-4S dicluster domain-containing protein [Bacteroidetes bacterium]|nr:4Fe-4S dicluster domain-containing protein [Bacteroidota bacterium]
MIKQLIFASTLIITLGAFSWTMMRIFSYMKFTKPFPIKNIPQRFIVMMKVAIGQTKIFRHPVMGLLHALVFWGFLVILIGSVEMLADGLFATERVLSFMGPVYNVLFASGDIFAFIIVIAILIFLFRRVFMHVGRFYGAEMKKVSKIDANIALTIILMLMLTLLGMNTFYVLSSAAAGHELLGFYPLSEYIAQWINLSGETVFVWHEIYWWAHILLIFIFANVLPYSKHFHVFMSVPNVFLSRLEPLGYLSNMPAITKEVKLMMDPNAAFDTPAEGEEDVERFGVLDAEDSTWKNYLDALACTECGRCTAVCPANITGKKLSPRKIVMDLRARMKEKGPGLVKEGKDFSDNKSLIRDYITEEELWACTTCNACAQECPISINHPSIIVDMRRYLVMEESAAPGELNAAFTNIENNGAPWQFSPEDRMKWAEDVNLEVPILADKIAEGKQVEYLFWLSSAGTFDDRYKKVSREFIKVLNHLKVDYAVLGVEETDSGDIARRAGNEMLFQMQAMMNIEIMNAYEVKKIITCDPHDFNTLKNEYPEFDGKFEVIHHSQFLAQMIKDGNLQLNNTFEGQRITFHDPCYLGRGNGEYAAPREVLKALSAKNIEMARCKSYALCCGAGGGQMFKEAEKGDKEVFIERIEDAIETKADIVATACPFCMVMITDGIKYKNKEKEMRNLDIAELVSQSLGL